MATPAPTFVDTFRWRVQQGRQKTALLRHDGKEWLPIGWGEWETQAQALAAALIDLGIGAGDAVAIISPTCWQWLLVDMAIMMAGAVTVPIYPSEPAERILALLAGVEVRLVFVGAGQPAARLGAVADRLGRPVVTLGPGPARDGWRPLSGLLDEGQASYQRGGAERVLSRSAALTSVSAASLVYTSGTTGQPKPVILSHRNLVWAAEIVQELGVSEEDIQLLFLPLSHTFSRSLAYGFVRAGGVVALGRGEEHLIGDLATVRPTFLAGVPRFFERVHRRLWTVAEKDGGLTQMLFAWAAGVADQAGERFGAHRRLSGTLRVQQVIAERSLGRQVKALFGGRVRLIVSGLGALSVPLARFYLGLGIEVLEGYGLTETAGATHVNRPGQVREGTVGRPFSGVEARIAADGEIQLRGPNVARAYLNRADETRASFLPGGWFCTGDLGQLEPDGTLTVSGRKKDLITLARGKQVAPAAVETRLLQSPFIAQAAVFGDHREYLTALLTLERTAILDWAAKVGRAECTFESLCANAEVYSLIDTAVRACNARAASYEAVKKFAILDRPFGIDEGELTPTRKLRRRQVHQRHHDLFESFYAERY